MTTEDLSFEILDSGSVSSMQGQWTASMGVEREMSQSRMRMSSSGSNPKSPLVVNNRESNRPDVAMDVLLRRKSPSAEVLKSFILPSLSQEFPSLSSGNLSEEDMTKLQTIVAEHQQLRDNLIKANAVIKTYFTAVEKWQDDVKRSKEADRRNIAELMDNNRQLHRELGTKNAQSSPLSSSTSTSNDVAMETMISRELENVKLQLAQTKEHAKDMVDRQTYKSVERQCSQLLAENLQFKDMEQQYIDTINCLKVNHASTEELVRMGQMDLNAERATSQKLRDELGAVREENQVLVQQAEIFQKDFIAERDARQRMAGEKEEVVQEMNRLRMMLATPTPQQPGVLQAQPSASQHYGLVRFTCPSCYSQYNSQQLLAQHLPHCGRQN